MIIIIGLKIILFINIILLNRANLVSKLHKILYLLNKKLYRKVILLMINFNKLPNKLLNLKNKHQLLMILKNLILKDFLNLHSKILDEFIN
jgi:hypothetical protein